MPSRFRYPLTFVDGSVGGECWPVHRGVVFGGVGGVELADLGGVDGELLGAVVAKGGEFGREVAARRISGGVGYQRLRGRLNGKRNASEQQQQDQTRYEGITDQFSHRRGHLFDPSIAHQR
jgi:hypothetical protein